MKKKLLLVVITIGIVQALGVSWGSNEEVTKTSTENTITINQGIDYEYIESQKPLDDAKTKLDKEANAKNNLK